MALSLKKLGLDKPSKGQDWYFKSDARPWGGVDSESASAIQLPERKPEAQKTTGDEPETKWRQSGDKPETNRSQTRDKVESRPNLTRDKVESELETQVETKWRQSGDKLKTSGGFLGLVGLQKEITYFIYSQTKRNRERLTGPITILSLAQACNTTVSSAKKTIQRLESKQIIRRPLFKDGRSGWSIYELPDYIYQDILNLEIGDKLETKWRQTRDKVESELETELETRPRSSSSSSKLNLIKPTTNPSESEFLENLQKVIARDGLEEFGLGENDLLGAWGIGRFESPEDFFDSLEHIAFYLRTKDAASINSPKRWAISKLNLGYYGRPANFESWEERQVRMKTEAAMKKQQALEELQKRRDEADFRVWMLQLPPEKKTVLLRGLPGINPNSTLAEDFLRQAYNEEMSISKMGDTLEV